MQQQTILNKGLRVTLEDIRNPLSCIMLSAEMLKDDNLNEAQKLYILSIISNKCSDINHDVVEMCNFLNALSTEQVM